jgi:hypothetical protein
LKLLLDEMYPGVLSERLRLDSIDASCAIELGLAGRSDPDLFAAAVDDGYTLVTENVADFARIAAEHLSAGRHHPGILVALSSRFSRRPAGIAPLVAAIRNVNDAEVADRVIYLESQAGG